MKKDNLKRLISVASGKIKADLVIRNGKIVDVYTGRIIEADLALCGGLIAGIGAYEGVAVIDAEGLYVLPGFIDSHIHIESSFLRPSELGRLLVPHGTTAIIADPHEIVNVCGRAGLEFMMNDAENTALDIKFMLPSCVPATPFEHSGASLDAAAMEQPIQDKRILGLGEMMNYPGVIGAESEVLDKLILAINSGKLIDGHGPGVAGRDLDACAAGAIHTDHECATREEMEDRLSRGMYVMLRQGSACKDLRNLIPALTPQNSRHCLLCSDDLQPSSVFEQGHIDNDLRICVDEGVDPVTAIQMATLNAAECYRLYDRGGIAPGLRADLVLVNNLKDFAVRQVFIGGIPAAGDGQYVLPVSHSDDKAVRGSFQVKDFSAEKLALPLSKDEVYVI
ncbi:MAG: amidohydrolase family protein, partial [Treponema sp.]|nr:amidohydrolase family protein [Treponema sp.]